MIFPLIIIFVRSPLSTLGEMATQREADLEKWDNKAGRMVKSKKESTRELNYSRHASGQSFRSTVRDDDHGH